MTKPQKKWKHWKPQAPDQIWLFSGLFSSIIPRYRKDMMALEKRLDDLLPDGETSTHFRIWNKWEKAEQEIYRRHCVDFGRRIILIGHSNGVYAILKIAEALETRGANVDMIVSIDRTLKRCPKAGPNIRAVLDYHAKLKYVEYSPLFNGFKQVREVRHVSPMMGMKGVNVGHIAAAGMPWVHDEIIKFITALLALDGDKTIPLSTLQKE